MPDHRRTLSKRELLDHQRNFSSKKANPVTEQNNSSYEQGQEMASRAANLVALISDGLKPATEATIGYRQALLDNGFPPNCAAKCATDFHGYVLEMLVAQIRPLP